MSHLGRRGAALRAACGRLRLLAVCLVALSLAAAPRADAADEERFLSVEQAPGAVFPDAQIVARRDVPMTPALRAAIERRLGELHPSIWEEVLTTFTARRGDETLGYAVIVEEIGKHRPITSIVAIRPDGHVHDVAVMVYREAYGGEVQQRRFLDQYPGAEASQALSGRIRNVAGATLSVEALNRSVRKAQAMIDAIYLHPEATPTPDGRP